LLNPLISSLNLLLMKYYDWSAVKICFQNSTLRDNQQDVSKENKNLTIIYLISIVSVYINFAMHTLNVQPSNPYVIYEYCDN
jgi:hypothetical protein